MTSVWQDGKAVVSRLRIKAHSSDPSATRLQVDRWLNAVRWQPAGLPLSAILVIRQLRGSVHSVKKPPSIGSFSIMQEERALGDAVERAIEQVASRAAFPARGFVPADAEAVTFQDRAELLACLARDWTGGNASTRWWWRSLFPATDLYAVAPRLWAEAAEYAPAALELLAGKRTAVAFARALRKNDVIAIRRAVTERFALQEIERCLTEIESLIDGGGPDKSYERLPSFWQRWPVESHDSSLGWARQSLLGVGLMVARAPAQLRSRGFAQSLRAQVEAITKAIVSAGRSEVGAMKREVAALSNVSPPAKAPVSRNESNVSPSVKAPVSRNDRSGNLFPLEERESGSSTVTPASKLPSKDETAIKSKLHSPLRAGEAAAGARLRAEIGAVLTILAHDIKAGAGVNGIAGVKAYAEATPVIGYREKAAEGEDKKGEWFIRGDLEVAAQPFLGLSGDLFVEIDAPWWSPVPDKKWTWPMFNKEWPLDCTMGMLVSVDYVFGSGQWPKFDFKPVAFDSNKFTTNLYENKAKSGSGKEIEQKGKWGEKNSAAAQPPAKTSPKGNASPGKPAALPAAKSKPLASKKGDKAVDPNAKTKEGKTVKQLQDEAAKKGKKPEGADAKGASKTDSAKKGEGKAPGDYIYEKREGSHTIYIGRDLKVIRFSTPSVLTGDAAQAVQQKALESIVPRTNMQYPTDSLGPSRRAKGPSGHVKDVKTGEERGSMAGSGVGYQPGDHRGHLIGDRFHGSGELSNLVPMHPTLNLSTFKSYENKLATAYLKLKQDKKAVLLFMSVVPDYPSNVASNPASFRPTTVTGKSKIITLKPGASNLTAENKEINSTPLSNPQL